MQREEFLKALTYLGLVYSKEFTQEQVSVWYGFFKNDSYDDFRDAIKRISVKSKFMPSIAELKGEMAEQSTAQLDADEAWTGVVKAIGRYGYYRSEEAMKSLPDLTRNAIQCMGGFQRLCASEDNEWLRKDFAKVYDDMRTRNIERYVTGDLITIADVVQKKMLLESSN